MDATPSATPLPTGAELTRIRRGFGLLGPALALNAIGTVARFGPHIPAFMIGGGVAWVGAILLSLFGVLTVAAGMRLSLTMRVFTCILVLIPFASFVVLLVLRIKAAEALRQAGYTVQVFSAEKS